MRHLLILAALIATPVFAQTAPMAGVIGNTLKMTTSGHTIAYKFHADGTMDAQVTPRMTMAGSWMLRGDQVCMKLSMQGMTGPEQCVPAVPGDKHAGDSWDMTVNGKTTHAEIVAGQ
jgi:hypothetical protein